jgi:hypothetical protein
MYDEEYYTPEEAVKSILTHNLFGLDIDTRAAQLARFAVLLKAANYYPEVLKKGWMPQIYAMPELYIFTRQEILDFLGKEGLDYEEELTEALKLMRDAQNLGSTMILDLSKAGRAFILDRLKELQTSQFQDLTLQLLVKKIAPYISVMAILTDQYEAVAANPPYMGSGNMNGRLKDYLATFYPNTKSDLFAAFMEVCLERNVKNGLTGMINQHSWMFLSSFEKLRDKLNLEYGIQSMLHLGPRTFDELSGDVVQSTAFVIQNGKLISKGNYVRLVDFKSNTEKEKEFLTGNHRHLQISQINFSKIPGSPIAYWMSENGLSNFENDLLKGKIKAAVGLNTGKNDYFLKIWHEIDYRKIDFTQKNIVDAANSSFKWFPYNKGGSRKKWYGNQIFVLNYENDGFEVKEFAEVRNKGKHWSRYIQNLKYMFQEGVTWSDIASKDFVARYTPSGFLFDVKGSSGFPFNPDELWKILAVMCSKISDYFIKAVNPTITLQVGDLSRTPLPNKLFSIEYEMVDYLVKKAVTISKSDWDMREASWNFERSLLLNKSHSLKNAYQTWEQEATKDFLELHDNEEKLNQILIEIYGLEEELTPEVPLTEITILQDELDGKRLEKIQDGRQKTEDGSWSGVKLPIKKDVVMKQLISYAIGLTMGRYRLDRPGLNIAHPDPTPEELAGYSYRDYPVEIDEDGIIPVMGSACTFADDALQRVKYFLEVVWGESTLTQNLNFLQESLDEDLESYLVKKFWADHCKTYKKKPIYWLFSSEKGAFQVLAYMHRMNAFTVEKIRSNYLMPHLKHLRSQIDRLQSSQEDPRLLDRLQKNLSDCESYDLILKDVADRQITFDLDDGVTKNYELFEGVVGKVK